MIINLETFLAEAEESSSGLELLLPATSELVAGIFAFAIVFFFVLHFCFFYILLIYINFIQN